MRARSLPLLLAVALWARPAAAFDNSACWHYAEQDGPHPEISCTPLSTGLLTSLQNAPLAQVEAAMNERGEEYPDGTLRFVGNYLGNGPGYQGMLSFTFNAAGQVATIDAKLDNPTQGGAYYAYHWAYPGPAISGIPGGQ